VRTTLRMGVYSTNQGHAFLINTTGCEVTPLGEQCNTLSPITTIILNDLLPIMRSRLAIMKVDVEGNEVNIFTDHSAGEFFEHIDIPVVFMEWHRSGLPFAVRRFAEFFYSRNYYTFALHHKKLKKVKDHERWPVNIIFKKSSYAHIKI